MSTLVFDPSPPPPAPLLPFLPPAYIDVREISSPPYLPPRFLALKSTLGNWSLVAFGDVIEGSGIQGHSFMCPR